MLRILSTLMLLVYSIGSFAGVFYKGEYRLGLYNDSVFTPSQITHIIVVGTAAKEDSNQFFQSGITRAHRYKELYPTHQVVIMSSPEVRRTNDDEVFREFNIFVFKTVKETFTGDRLLAELSQFEKIASLDYFGHSSPWGLKLGKSDAALDPTVYKNKIASLKSKFIANAYMTISSCNSGFIIAPEFSRLLEIPVAGALTSSLFERIESDGHWYKEEDYTRENYVDQNNFSYNDNVPCSQGLCVRMKASRSSYSAYWGQFKEGGLSFYKFFCNFENNNKCLKGMASSLFGLPSVKALSSKPALEDYKLVVFDWLCSSANNKEYYKNCVNGILNAVQKGDLVYQSHPGNELICDYKSCKAQVVCKGKLFGSGPKAGSCKLNTQNNPRPINAAREYLDLLKGFQLLME
jgi:hypothetical protein